VKLLRFAVDGQARYGLLQPDGTILALRGESPFESLTPGRPVARLEDVQLLAPVTPSTVVGIGSNFHSHRGGKSAPEFPMLFLKPPAALIGPDVPIVLPKVAGPTVDYEAELTVVIGRRARHVRERDALDYVLGYTVGNDVSAREWQKREMAIGTLVRGKGFDTFCPLGPVIDTEIDPTDVQIEAVVNGAVAYRART